MFIDHCNQQVVLRKNSKPRVMLWDERGDQPSKTRENLDFSSNSARILALSSQRLSTIRCEANKSNRRREERPIASGSRAVKMLRDLRRHARGHVAAANARAEVRARMHNWSI